MNKRLFIYRIRHVESGRSYIGWTIHPEKRWRRHQATAAKGGKNAIHCALRLYSAAAFSFEVIEELTGTEADARAREVWWVAVEGTLSPGGYNMTEGGDGADGLGRLAAAAHVARRALDVDADRERRRAGAAKANAGVSAEARSIRGQRAWANRSAAEKAKAIKRFEYHRNSLTPEQRAELGRRAAASGTAEDRANRARKGNAALTSAQRQSSLRAMHAAQGMLTSDERSRIGRAGAAARTAKTTPEQRRASALARWASTSPEQRAEIARRRWVTRRRNNQQKIDPLE